jgi:hypothetical protein
MLHTQSLSKKRKRWEMKVKMENVSELTFIPSQLPWLANNCWHSSWYVYSLVGDLGEKIELEIIYWKVLFYNKTSQNISSNANFYLTLKFSESQF